MAGPGGCDGRRGEGEGVGGDGVEAGRVGEIVEIDTRTVDVHVSALRERLNGAQSTIETVWGVGYKLVDRGGEDEDEGGGQPVEG